MKDIRKKVGILVFALVLSMSAPVSAQEDDVDFSQVQDVQTQKIKANKDSLNKAQEAINNKDFQTAINLLTAYINSKPKKYEPYKMRGDAYYALRRYYLAQQDYQTAVNIKTDDDKMSTSTKYISAIILGADKNEQLQNAELGDLYGALMYAQKAQNDPAYATSYENAVKYNSHIYLPQPKKQDINKINCPQKYGKALNPKGVDEKIYGAIDDIEQENFNEALYKLQSVTTDYPNYYMGHYLSGVALAGLDKTDDAVKSFETSIKLNPYDFESYASLGQIYYRKAETTFNADDSKKSIQYFNKALELNKNCPTYYFYIGMNELQNGDTNKAISNFNNAIKLNSSDYNSMYYKLIAQYINGNYQDVIDGSTKLLYRYVSNYNSVLYLRALAYTKINDTEKAMQDLDTIESNIEDIYNTDVKKTTPREKSLESYIHYLKSEIQHSHGAGAASDKAQSYNNPIINILANAQKAMDPYENALSKDTISPADYKRFEYFYSTSLPKMLESGAVITYDDIDNQYDYIRTTFADLGISFVYNKPYYRITTIKDYPQKKYASKVKDGQISTDVPSNNDTPVINMQQSTPQSEMIASKDEPSLARMLATNALTERTQLQENNQTQNKEVKKVPQLRTSEEKTQFKPEVPDGERVNSSKNIASGGQYTGTPLVDDKNSQNVKNILEEEKTMDNANTTAKPDVNTSNDGSIKIFAKEIKQTPDVVIKHEPQPLQQAASTVASTTAAVATTAAATADKTAKTVETATTKAESQIQKATDTSKEKVKKADKHIKYTKNKAQEKVQETAAKTKDNLNTLSENAANEVQTSKTEISQNINSNKQTIKQSFDDLAKAKAETEQIKTEKPKVNEKYADINPKDFGVQSQKLEIGKNSDVIELQTDNLANKYSHDSDIFTKDGTKTVIANKQPVKEEAKIIKESEKTLAQPQDEITIPETTDSSAAKETIKEVPVVTVPEIRNPEKTAKAEAVVKEPVKEPEIVVPEMSAPITAVSSDKQVVKEQLSDVLDEILPDTSETSAAAQTTAAQQANNAEDKLNDSINKAQALKEERLRLKQQAKLAKQQAKEQAKAEKQRLKEEQKLAANQAKEQKAKQLELEKAQKEKLKEEQKLLQTKEEIIKESKEDAVQDAQKAQEQALKEAQEQKKLMEESDELKVQNIIEKQQAQAPEQTPEQIKAQKEQLKAERKKAQEEYKARKAAQKAQQKASKEQNQTSGFKTFLSKMKFWEKNK